jgi:hypothetical protein
VPDEELCDDEAQDGVAEEGERLVVWNRRVLVRVRRMSQGLAQEVGHPRQAETDR